MKKMIFALVFAFASLFLYSQESKWIDSTEFKELSYKVPKLMNWRISDDNKELWIIDSTYKFFKFDISTGAILDTFLFNKDGRPIKVSRDMKSYYQPNISNYKQIPIKIYNITNDNLLIDDTLKYNIPSSHSQYFSDFGLFSDINENFEIKLILTYKETWYNMDYVIYEYSGIYLNFKRIGNAYILDTNNFATLGTDCNFFKNLAFNIITNNYKQITSGKTYSTQGYQNIKIIKNSNVIVNQILSLSTNNQISSPIISYDENWFSIKSNDTIITTGSILQNKFYVKNIKNLLKIYPFYNNLNSNYNNYFLTHFYDDFGKSKIIAWRYDNDFILNEKEILNYFPKKSISYFGTKSSLLFSDDYGTVRVYKFDDVKESDTKINPPKSLIYRLSDTVKLSGTTSANTPEIVWDYGDGTRDSNKLNVNHIFKKTGNLLVKFIAKDQNGISFDTISIKIIKDLVPKFDFEFLLSGDTSKVQFHNQSEGDILKYKWDFADGEKSNDIEPIHNYFNKGNYLVKLTATDEVGSKEYFVNTYVSIKENQNYVIDNSKIFSKWVYGTYYVNKNYISAVEIEEDIAIISSRDITINKEGWWHVESFNLLNGKFENGIGRNIARYLRNINNYDYYEAFEPNSNVGTFLRNSNSNKTKGDIQYEYYIKDDATEFDNDSLPIFISNFNFHDSAIILNRAVSFNPPLRVKTKTLPIRVPLALGFNKIKNEVMLAYMKDSITLKMLIFEHDSLRWIDSIEYKNENILAIYGGCSLNDGYYFTTVLKKDTTKVAAILHFDYDFNLLNIEYDYNNNKLAGNVRKFSDTSFVYVGIYPNNKYNFNLYKINDKQTCYNVLSDSIFNIASITKGIKNSIIVAGNKGNYTNIVFKINFEDYKFPTGFEESKPKSNSTNYLNFPNPFNQSTQFEFNSDTSGQYNMKIIDYLGVELFNETGIAIEGKNTINFSRKGLSPGVYFCKIVCGNQNFNYKFMISE